jgi:hypothetical protein
MSLSGACYCGAVTVAAAADPLAVRTCWCTDCQKLTAGSPTNNVFFRSEDVTLAGELRWYDGTADSGQVLARAFCPACGTAVAVQSHARRHLIAIRLGMFDQRDALAPAAIIWAASAPAWAQLDPALPATDHQPPPAG